MGVQTGQDSLFRVNPQQVPMAQHNTFDPIEIFSLLRTRSSHWHNNVDRSFTTGLVGLIEQCHSTNFSLWHEEDIARRDDLPAAQIRNAKRRIDQLNQQRNDFVEAIDSQLVLELQPPTGDCPFNSETPGMMIDRLSILALKEYHMAEETFRKTAGEDHQYECARKLEIIRQQQDALLLALTTLIKDVRNKTRSFKVYYQFKMYNSKELNPELRAADTPTLERK